MQENNMLIGQAIARALALHKGQKRKGSPEIPYIAHPIEVGLIVSYYASRSDLMIAALLHDTVEDCVYTLPEVEQEFGKDIRDLVAALTHDKSITDRQERTIEHINRLRQNRDAYFIKAADNLANMRALIATLKREGAAVWKRFNSTKIEKLAELRIVLDETIGFLPSAMVEEYASLLKDIEYSEVLEKKSALGFVAA